ncbi:BCL-2-associated athanogene 5 [Corchorus olitorius]|uniref:BCL-2-associated athanogene 5 n=1 Tax=Corchorus olitorius TaxID=93759 RepID=A0A1R3KFF6_9ROSI|nr:BCL-2-associated athanogene 5 [Corchorus olitorius]
MEVTNQQILSNFFFQSAYRVCIICNLYKQISAVNAEANRLQHLIQRQDTVDSIMSDEVVEEMEEQLCRERGGPEMESLGGELSALAKEERWSGA